MRRPDGPATLVAELERRDLEVDWLVNNAGFGTVGRFDRLPVERELEEIRLNVKAPVDADRSPPARHGRARPRRRHERGVDGRLRADALHRHVRGDQGVPAELLRSARRRAAPAPACTCVCVCPGFTRTEFQEKAKVDTSMLPSFAWMSAETVADQAVARRGIGRACW